MNITVSSQVKANPSIGGISFELQDNPSVSPHLSDAKDTSPTSYIMLKVVISPELVISTTEINAVCPTFPQGHVRPILPAGTPNSQSLPFA